MTLKKTFPLGLAYKFVKKVTTPEEQMTLKKTFPLGLAYESVKKVTTPEEEKPIQQPRSDVDIRKQPESKQTTVFPKQHQVKWTPTKDGGMIYESSEKNQSLTADQYANFVKAQKFYSGGGKGDFEGIDPKVKELIDYDAVQRSLHPLDTSDLPGIPKGISNQEQLDLYNQSIGKDQAAKNAEIAKLVAQESGKPVEPIPTSENPMQQAGFVGASLAGSTSLEGLGTIGAGALIGSAVPGVGTAIGAGVGVAITVGKAFLASASKSREQDIATARGNSNYAMKQLKLQMARAAQPGADTEDILRDYYDYKRTIYAAEAVLSNPKLLNAININEGLDELGRIKQWMANDEDNNDADIQTRLAYGGDIATYNAEIGSALAALQETPK